MSLPGLFPLAKKISKSQIKKKVFARYVRFVFDLKIGFFKSKSNKSKSNKSSSFAACARMYIRIFAKKLRQISNQTFAKNRASSLVAMGPSFFIHFFFFNSARHLWWLTAECKFLVTFRAVAKSQIQQIKPNPNHACARSLFFFADLSLPKIGNFFFPWPFGATPPARQPGRAFSSGAAGLPGRSAYCLQAFKSGLFCRAALWGVDFPVCPRQSGNNSTVKPALRAIDVIARSAPALDRRGLWFLAQNSNIFRENPPLGLD